MRGALRETNTRDTYLGVELRLIHESDIDFAGEVWHVRANNGTYLATSYNALDAFELARQRLEEHAASLLMEVYN